MPAEGETHTGDLLDQDLLSLHNCVHAAHEAATGRHLPARDAVGRMHALQLSQRRFRLLAATSRLMKDDVARRFGVPVIENDAYGELRYSGEPLPSLKQLDAGGGTVLYRGIRAVE